MEKMKGFQKLMALVICVMMVMGFAPGLIPEMKAEEQQATVDAYTYTYTVSNDEATITSVDPLPSGVYTIPDKLNNYPVTGIGENVFDCACFTSVTIPDSVTDIGKEAFLFCKELKEVRISDLAAWCAITFETEESNPLANNNENNDEVNLFINGEKIKDLVIPDGVKIIGNYAFYSGCFWSVMIPPDVEEIGDYAFTKCSMQSVTISEGVTRIGKRAFYSCPNIQTLYYIGSEISLLDVDLDHDWKDDSIKVTFAPRVTLIVNPAGAGTVSGGGTGPMDRKVTVTATPAFGCSFVNWTNSQGEVIKDLDGQVVGAEYTFTVSGNRKLTANFIDSALESPKPDKINIADATVEVGKQVYTGKKLTPALTVTVNGNLLELNTDYKVKWKNNRKIGKATVTLTGIGNYKGTTKKNFMILPQPVKEIRLKDGLGTLTASWKIKKGSDIDGYEIEYWWEKGKTDKQKTLITRKNTKKLEIKNAKQDKDCHVRIRTYKLVNGKKVWSEWSETVKSKVR